MKHQKHHVWTKVKEALKELYQDMPINLHKPWYNEAEIISRSVWINTKTTWQRPCIGMRTNKNTDQSKQKWWHKHKTYCMSNICTLAQADVCSHVKLMMDGTSWSHAFMLLPLHQTTAATRAGPYSTRVLRKLQQQRVPVHHFHQRLASVSLNHHVHA